MICSFACLLKPQGEEEGSTYDESMEVGPGPFTCEVPLRSSLRIGYVFCQKRSQRVRLYHTNIQQIGSEKERISLIIYGSAAGEPPS